MRGERIVSCELVAQVPFRQNPLSSHSPSQRAGISYERRVTKLLNRRGGFISQLAFHYQLKYERSARLCVIDGLKWKYEVDYPSLCVIEIKNQLNEYAFKQLSFYMELVAWWSRLPVSGLLICNETRELLAGECYPNIVVAGWGARTLKRFEREAERNGAERNTSTSHSTLWASGSAGNHLDSCLRVPRLGQSMWETPTRRNPQTNLWVAREKACNAYSELRGNGRNQKQFGSVDPNCASLEKAMSKQDTIFQIAMAQAETAIDEVQKKVVDLTTSLRLKRERREQVLRGVENGEKLATSVAMDVARRRRSG
jgi:hypothetical protein